MNYLAILLALTQEFIPFFGTTTSPVIPDVMQEFFEGSFGITIFQGDSAGVGGTCDLNGWQSKQDNIATNNKLFADYTPAIDGTKSFQNRSDVGLYADIFHSITIPTGDNLYGYFKLNISTNTSSGDLQLFTLGPIAADGIMFSVFLKSSWELQITDGYATTNTVAVLTNATTYSVWTHYNWITSQGELWFSTNGNKTITGSTNYCTINSGNIFTSPRTIALGQLFSWPNPSAAATQFIIDRIYLSTQPIGDNP